MYVKIENIKILFYVRIFKMLPSFKVKSISVIIACTLSLPVFANTNQQPPSDQSLQKMMKLFDFEWHDKKNQEFYIQVLSKEKAQAQQQKYQLTDSQVERLTVLYEKQAQQANDLVSNHTDTRQRLKENFVTLAKEHFTQEEIDTYNKILALPNSKQFLHEYHKFLRLLIKAEQEILLEGALELEEELKQLELQTEKEAMKILTE